MRAQMIKAGCTCYSSSGMERYTNSEGSTVVAREKLDILLCSEASAGGGGGKGIRKVEKKARPCSALTASSEIGQLWQWCCT